MDAKLKRLKMRYGMEGYGLYWYCLEIIAANVDQNNYTFELTHDAEIISFDTGLHKDQIEEMMRYMVELNLFESSNGIITCLKMAKRLDQSMTSNPILRNIIKKNHDGVMILSEQIRLDKIRNKQYVSSGDDTLIQCDCPKKANGKDFERFWESWPVKRNKAKARQAFIRKKFDLEDVETLIADVKDRIKHDPQWKRGFIPHCSTYLNGERWEDSYNGN